MALYELSSSSIATLERVDFSTVGLLERADLQRLLRDHVKVIAPDTLVISEEFSNWDRSDRRIDLLGVDRQGQLVVIELKRTTDDSFADLQALRYASMVARMTFSEAVDAYRAYMSRRGIEGDAEKGLLDFLGWPDATSGRFGEDVRIVLAAADFSPEVTSTVLWLNERDLDIRCVRLQPYRLGPSILLDVQQIIPLPEASEFQIQIRQKQREVRAASEQSADWTRYDVTTDEGISKGLFKREVVLAAVRQLVKRGKSPSEIEAAAGRVLFERADGSVAGEEFKAEIQRRRPNDLRADKRFFVGDDQLFHADGHTYALTNQWSKASMEALLTALQQEFGDFGLTVQAAE